MSRPAPPGSSRRPRRVPIPTGDDPNGGAGAAVGRFLSRHLDLAERVREVLQCGEELRSARDAAFAEPGLPAPEPSGENRRARERLAAAVAELETLAGGPEPARAEALVRPGEAALCALADLRASSHRFAPPRTLRSKVARRPLLAAIDAFRRAFAALDEAARERGARRLPWQLELASHAAPGTPVRRMRITGYDLPRVPAARRPWGERCLLSGRVFATDRHQEPEARFRSLDSWSHVLAPGPYDLVSRLRRALERARPASLPAAERIARAHPFVFSEYVEEPASATFLTLGVLDPPSLPASLNNMLRLYRDRPLFGVQGSRGELPCLGQADAVAVARGEGATGYVWLRYGEVRRRALVLAFALERLGLRPGDRLGFMACENRPEVYLTDFAALFAGLVSVGLPESLTGERLADAIARTGLRAVVADAASLPRFLGAGAPRGVEWVLGFGGESPWSGVAGGRVLDLDRLLDEEPPVGWRSASGVGPATGVVYGDGDEAEAEDAAALVPDGDRLYTILFTSGSTGPPKGTPVTLRRWAEEMCFDANLWPLVGASFQPAALAADRGSVWRAVYNGGRIGFARRGAALFPDLRAIRPTLLDAPPVVWSSLHGEYRRAVGDPTLSPRGVAEVRRRFRGLLGGRLAFAATGGAPSDPAMRRGVEEILGIPLADSYGTTETGNVARDGELLPGIEYRLLPVPELGYSPGDQPLPRGELAVRTPRTTSRYVGDDEGTRRGYTDDGYFRTGDVVALGPGRRVRWLGRRAQFFKLADAEPVSPAAVEEVYRASPLVEAILVTALPGAEAVAAVVVPARDGLGEESLRAELGRVGRRAGLRPAEIPAVVAIEARRDGRLPWTVEDGGLTPSLKLDRAALEERYRERLSKAWEALQRRRREAGGDMPSAAGGSDPGQVRETVLQIAAAILGLPPERLEAERSFAEQGGDSTGALQLALRLDQVFGAADEDPELLVHSPLSELAERLAGGRGGIAGPPADTGPEAPPVRSAASEATGRGAAPAGRDRAALVAADGEDVPRPAPLPPPARGADVFVTGGTGFLGSHLVAHLAATLAPEARIWALVRAASHEAARERLVEALARAAPEPPAVADADADRVTGERVVAVAGLLDAPRLGLQPDLYRRLAGAVGSIIHAAARVSFGGTYEDLRGANVVGTRRVLELAADTTLKRVHLISSLNVLLLVQQAVGPGVEEASPLPESLLPRLIEDAGGYGLTKWVGERMLLALARHCGPALDASVSRPALLGWSTTTGRANGDDWLARVLASCLRIRAVVAPPEAAAPSWIPETPVTARGLDVVPVDFAARSIVRIAGSGGRPDPSAPVPVFHVSNTAPGERGLVTLGRLMDLLVAADLRHGARHPPLRPLPFDDWALLAESAAAPAAAILGQLRRMAPALPRTPAARFASVVPPATCPPIDRRLLGVFVERFYREADPG